MRVKCIHDCRFDVTINGQTIPVDRPDRDSEWAFVSPQGHEVYLFDFAQVLVHLSCCADDDTVCSNRRVCVSR